ncbi:MAG: nucleotidyl transferase AbiEii/AbiGii toxin family protein [Candidatus Omnitrophica bacterium]|nr:nucleotidyl transferase AbiEii/AbiGii toxin family protein [Candidatus Omnitrophota bacterium]
MIEVIKQQFAKDAPTEERLNRTREFLQLLCLNILYDKGHFERLAFTGGTALRVVYGLRRFSEDIDFSLLHKKGYSFPAVSDDLLKELHLSGLKAESKPKYEKTVHSTMLKFPGILKEVGVSALKDQKLSIKLDVDTNPPQGGKVEHSLIQKTHIFSVTHFDLASLFATKLHACFYRSYIKGRDIYDFIWYLARKVEPDFVLLNNAIRQTQGKDPGICKEKFRDFLLRGFEKVDFTAARKDVERFLEDKNELKLFDKERIQSHIRVAYG